MEVRNEGEPLADLFIQVVGPNDAEVRLNPAVQHAYLGTDQSLRFIASPVLYLEFQTLKAEIECRAAGQSSRFPLEFKAPDGKRLIGIRTATGNSSKSTGPCSWIYP